MVSVGVRARGFTVGSSVLVALGVVFAMVLTFAFGAFSRCFALAVDLAVVCAVTVVFQVGDPSLFSVSGAQGSLFFGAANAGVFSRVVVAHTLAADKAEMSFFAFFAQTVEITVFAQVSV